MVQRQRLDKPERERRFFLVDWKAPSKAVRGRDATGPAAIEWMILPVRGAVHQSEMRRKVQGS